MGRRFKFTDIEVKHGILRAFVEHKTNRLGFRALYRELQKDPKIRIVGFTTLQRCLKKYVDDGFLRKDSRSNQYELTENGRKDYEKKIDLDVIEGTKRVIQRKIVPNPDLNELLLAWYPVGPEGILPFNVSIHLDPRIESSIKVFERSFDIITSTTNKKAKEIPPIPEQEAQEKFLDGLSHKITAYYEWLFTSRLETVDHYWITHKAQQLPKKKRINFLYSCLNWPKKKKTKGMGKKEMEEIRIYEEMIKELEETLLEEKFEEENLLVDTFEKLLDFEGMCVVRVSRKMLRNEFENIRKRLVKWVIEHPDLPHRVCIDQHPVMKIILTPQEFKAYSKSRTNKQRETFLQKLREKYIDGHTDGNNVRVN